MLLLLFAQTQAPPTPVTSGGADGEATRRKRIRPPFIIGSPRLDLTSSRDQRRRRNAAILLAIAR